MIKFGWDERRSDFRIFKRIVMCRFMNNFQVKMLEIQTQDLVFESRFSMLEYTFNILKL